MRPAFNFLSREKLYDWFYLSPVNRILLHTDPDGTKEVIAVYQNGKRLTLLKMKVDAEPIKVRRKARRIALNMGLSLIED
ncbi:MAG TPA: hypothetical protein VH186_01680 [Chloroflexia bacterium]|nr:hypothetical protein [Chloroflexia bacterium]